MGKDQLGDLEVDGPITLRPWMESLGTSSKQNDVQYVMEDREVWQINLKLLPPQASRKIGQCRKKKKQ